MSESRPEANQDLSPEAVAVIARARRSFAFSMGLLILGFAAVALALVYRSGRSEETAGDHYRAGVLAIPAGAEVISALPSEGMIAIAYEKDGATKLRLIDGETGAVIRDIGFVSE